jgi:hypothetical protein
LFAALIYFEILWRIAGKPDQVIRVEELYAAKFRPDSGHRPERQSQGDQRHQIG